jgi:uncharacterized protein
MHSVSHILDSCVPSRYNMYTMNFEYDPKKSQSNKQKHGIDFREAQILWEDVDLLEIPAKEMDEPRFLVIGRITDKYWSGIITYRGKNIRIISVRRSRDEEIALYES